MVRTRGAPVPALAHRPIHTLLQEPQLYLTSNPSNVCDRFCVAFQRHP